MTLDPHVTLGIALTACYVPIAVLSIWLVWRNWHYHPRMAWWPTISLSLMRVGAGAVLIARQTNMYSEGLIIATLVLLNVGSISLIAINLGFVRAVYVDNYNDGSKSQMVDAILRSTIFPAISLLSAGAGISTSLPNAGKVLTLVGYIIFAVLLLSLVAADIVFWTRRSRLKKSSAVMLAGALVAAPFVIARNVYGLLEVATESSYNSIWSPISGNVLAVGLLGLLTEYIPVCIYLLVGFSIPPDRGAYTT
ncbi:hypothetical protein N7509_000500 [Penicillium cosmopolitanum]|uniref:DUF7702 domain-containing protein n=1 Tax=Penicillium cosmopolitanum TaxID=1131564 RepID=A0A9W9WAQ7_9EURO|nr:uncharacterized protein N7509_000500 [Penicillium cosmopolitanum]KAJ5413873.1 hypothetical protein N7509_000500 [Penicillium cosmopolitanum]